MSKSRSAGSSISANSLGLRVIGPARAIAPRQMMTPISAGIVNVVSMANSKA
jgi:hypothetical protein